MNRLDLGNINWYLFNMYGLEIEDQDEWRDFIFNNASIVNTKQLKEYLNEIEYYDNATIKDLLFQFKPEHTFLIIQTFGIITKENENDDQKQAEKRALEVAGFIYFVFLFLSDFRIGICLDRQIYNTNGIIFHLLTSYSFMSSKQKHNIDEALISLPRENLKYSRNALENIFNKKVFINIFKIVKLRDNVNVLDSISNLYFYSNIPSASSQLLGSVTAIELLLKDDKKYDWVGNRIQTLIGQRVFLDLVETNKDKFGVLKKRHNVIHDGKYCDSSDAYRGITLASYVIISYSYIIQIFPYKGKILKHLDIVHLIQNDNDLKEDQFGILQRWDSIKFDSSLIDWTVRRLIGFFGLCTTNKNQVSKDEYVKAIVWLSKIRNINLELSYNMIIDNIYYKDFPFNGFQEMNNYYSSIKDIIDTYIQEQETYIKF